MNVPDSDEDGGPLTGDWYDDDKADYRGEEDDDEYWSEDEDEDEYESEDYDDEYESGDDDDGSESERGHGNEDRSEEGVPFTKVTGGWS